LGIGIRSATDSFVLALTHRTSVQATVHIGTNKVQVSYRSCVFEVVRSKKLETVREGKLTTGTQQLI